MLGLLCSLVLTAPMPQRTGVVEPATLLPHANSSRSDRAEGSPLELLECLKRHRLTPLACEDPRVVLAANLHRRVGVHSAGECGDAGLERQLCNNGNGNCAYDAGRGWHCRCTRGRDANRGHSTTDVSARSPGCIAVDVAEST
eukprot:5959319-Prymnesium_polylepis.1